MITYKIARKSNGVTLNSPGIKIMCPGYGDTYFRADHLDKQFKSLIDELYDFQQGLMRREYAAVLQAIDNYNKGRALSIRAISRITAEYAYRMNISDQFDGSIYIDLPNAEATYKMDKKGVNHVTLKDIQLISGVEPSLPPLEDELAQVYRSISRDLSSTPELNKEISQ